MSLIVQRERSAFDFVGKCMGMKNGGAMVEKEITIFKVVKFTTIITLDETNRKKEVSSNIF